MFEVFDYRDGTPLFYVRYENTAKLFVSYVNKHNGGHLDYDAHTHSPGYEEATSPEHNGSFTVTVKCECGVTVNQYVDYCL